MAAGWKTVRIFISSTFRDMHRERDHLVRVVFPELKERCRTRHIRLIDVDLRWGVTEADAEHGKALDICLDEIDSCRPYFLGILGHRYGFIPEGHRYSITAQEIYHGVLHGSVPKQVIDLRKILEDKLEGQILSEEQKDSLVRCYRWDADKRKYLLREDVSPEDADIIRSVFWRYSIYQKGRSFFFFRGEALTRQLAGTKTNDFFEQKREDRDKLESLKREIADAELPHFEYIDIEVFGQLVLDTLWKRIEAEAEKTTSKKQDWLDQEDELHELFMAEHTRRFVGRRELLDRMHGFCDRDETSSLLVITGEPGCGKSALMARFAEEALALNPDRLILRHFVGASPSSTNLRQMLRRLCAHLNRILGVHEDVPEDIKELFELFPELLAKASEGRPLLIIIDAVNQIEQTDRAHSMTWLPRELPPNVHVVISTLSGEAHSAMLRRRFKPSEETMAGLTSSEIRELAGTYLREIRHEFPNQKVERDFYRKVERGIPLYILVALEEVRVFGDFEKLPDRINMLPDNVPALFDQVLERIESDFTPELVGDFMSYVACGHHGMAADELQTLLRAHAPSIEPNAEAPRFPDMLWRRLYRSVSAYFFERSGVIDFFHSQLKEAVGKRYLREESRRDSAHRAIADYLENRWREPYGRALAELPHQHLKAKNWQALVGILCDLEFIESKCQAEMTYDLVADYESAVRAKDIPVESRPRLDDFAHFVHSQSYVIARSAALTFQQAANAPDSTAPAMIARDRSEAGLERRPWLRWVNKLQGRAPYLLDLMGHTNEVYACAVSPDGTRIVSASADRTLKLWDAETGQELATLDGHMDLAVACAYSPDGSRIVSASADKTLRLWDGISGQELATLAGHTDELLSCAFSPDGRRILSASKDKTLKLWDAESGQELATLAGHTNWIMASAFSPDGRQIVSGSLDETMKLWDGVNGQELTALGGCRGSVHACAFSPDGRRIISAGGYHDFFSAEGSFGNLELWDVASRNEVALLAGHRDTVVACAYSPDGSRIVSASLDKTLKLWDAKSGRELATLAGHTKWITACSFSLDGRRIVSASDDKTLKIWDGATGQELTTLQGHTREVRACVFLPNGHRIVSASSDGTLKLWDATAKQQLSTFAGHGSHVNACTFSPDGSQILSASTDNTLRLWDGITGKALATLSGHKDRVRDCAFSPDGNLIVSASHDGTLKLWDPKSGQTLATFAASALKSRSLHWDSSAQDLDSLSAQREGVRICLFSPDNARLISSYVTGHVLTLWDVASARELSTLTGHTDFVTACAFSPDGRRIVSAAYDKTLKLWDGISGQMVATLAGHKGGVRDCAFSPNGCLILSASDDGTLKLWDAMAAAELATLEGHRDEVTICTFSPDGRRILSGSQDGTLKLWDAASNQELASLSGHKARVRECLFSSDGRWIASVSEDRTLRLWDGTTGLEKGEYWAGDAVLAAGWSPDGERLVVGSRGGSVDLLKLENMLFGPTIVTAWRRPSLRWQFFRQAGYHGVACPWCRVWSEVRSSALGTVISCPHCGGTIKLNPFTIEADWRPIAEAWKKR